MLGGTFDDKAAALNPCTWRYGYVRAEIAAALKAGETASKLPKKFGVSYNIIHEVKKKIGMVTARN
jgi:hypothetical protein